MSKIKVGLKINVSKIDKNRLFVGKKGKYLDAVVHLDLDNLNEYGNNGMVTQSVKREERLSGVRGEILGDAKIVWSEGLEAAHNNGVSSINNSLSQQQAPADQQPQNQGFQAPPAPDMDSFDDDILL